MKKDNTKETIYVKISVDELKCLLRESEELVVLESCGVDNWEGYCDAFDYYKEDNITASQYEYFREYTDNEFGEEFILENYERV